MKPWARYDRTFPDNPHVQAMPAKVRGNAYALLMAMNGYCYRRPATGRLLVAEAEMLAVKIGQRSRPLLAALVSVGLVEVEGATVVLPRFFEWNNELSPEVSEIRSEAGKAGAIGRWGYGKENGKPDGNLNGKSHAVSDAIQDGKPDGNGDARDKREEVRRSKEDLSQPPLPPRAIHAPSADPHVAALVDAWQGVVGRQITGADVRTAEEWVRDFSRATGEMLASWLQEAAEYRKGQKLEPLRQLALFRPAIRQRYDYVANDLPLRDPPNRGPDVGLVGIGAAATPPARAQEKASREVDPDDG